MCRLTRTICAAHGVAEVGLGELGKFEAADEGGEAVFGYQPKEYLALAEHLISSLHSGSPPNPTRKGSTRSAFVAHEDKGQTSSPH